MNCVRFQRYNVDDYIVTKCVVLSFTENKNLLKRIFAGKLEPKIKVAIGYSVCHPKDVCHFNGVKAKRISRGRAEFALHNFAQRQPSVFDGVPLYSVVAKKDLPSKLFPVEFLWMKRQIRYFKEAKLHGVKKHEEARETSEQPPCHQCARSSQKAQTDGHPCPGNLP